LSELLADKAKPVLLVEGEKCAEAAAGLLTGYAVTTWSGGAKATDRTDWMPLKGRSAVIWPDADKAGRDAASAIVALVEPIVAKVDGPRGSHLTPNATWKRIAKPYTSSWKHRESQPNPRFVAMCRTLAPSREFRASVHLLGTLRPG
jgi:hypothetical protein